MTLPTVTKTWTVSANNRITFVSLNDTCSRILFGIKNFLVATMGYTVKYTCDGTTGPTSSADHTDRWASATNAATRGTSVNVAQSFAVVTDGNGCDIMLAYQGATDSQARIAFSPSGVFLPAGTSNQQPTATDLMEMWPATSDLTNITGSLDRVWHIQASTDKKAFRFVNYRASTMTATFGLEVITREPAMMSNTVFNPPVVGWGTFVSNSLVGNGCAIGPVVGGGQGGQARLNGVISNVGGCGEIMNGTTFFSVANPELQAAAPIVPVGFATAQAGVAGKLGMRIDAWTVFCSGIGQGDTFGTLQFVYFGTLVLPWDGVSTPVIA